MLINLREICALAEERGIAVGAFNAVSLSSLKAVVWAAAELGQPVILQFAQCHEQFNSIEDLAPLMLKYAKSASVPVCVHLDHGEDLSYVQKALELGFTGVMFDGSTLPYAENAEKSHEAVRLAAQFGAGAEAELGSMGRRSSGEADGSGDGDETKIYTDPEQAASFARETGIDALACSFGTTHGIYLTKPRLDMDIVARVRERTGLPVVMHGGSGVSPEDFRRSIAAGVRKINYFTYMDKAGGAAVRDRLLSCGGFPLFTELCQTAEQAMKENVKDAIRVFSGL